LRIENAHGTVTFADENAPEWAFSKRNGVKVENRFCSTFYKSGFLKVEWI